MNGCCRYLNSETESIRLLQQKGAAVFKLRRSCFTYCCAPTKACREGGIHIRLRLILIQPFDNGCLTLTYPDTQSSQTIIRTFFGGSPAAHFMQQGGKDACTRASQGMPQSNRASIHIGNFSGQAQLLHDCQGLDRKSTRLNSS